MTTSPTKPRKWLCEDEATPEAKMYQALRFIAEDLAAGVTPLREVRGEVAYWIAEANRS